MSFFVNSVASGSNATSSFQSQEEESKAELESPRCPVRDCFLPVDVILESSDGQRFGAHTANLQQYSEGFPIGESVNVDGNIPRLEEKSDALKILLRFMHHAKQPDLSDLPVSTLSDVAEAAEKYMIYSAMGLCNVYMELTVDQHPTDVLIYAFKHDYPKLADKSARLTLTDDAAEMATKALQANLHQTFIVAWLRYREGWADQMRSMAHVPPTSGALLHKGGLQECDLWKPFHRAVLADVGVYVSGLARLEVVIRNNIPQHLDDCMYCTRRAIRWADLVKTASTSHSLKFI